MYRPSRLVFVLVSTALLLLPAMAYAQASIAGVVRDGSGAVMPGVTVEAASPALIEKLRSVVTDGSGQFRIVDLRPGTYSVAFSLQGFTTVKREGIELAGSFNATVNVELRVGEVTETVTVTGESPIVDVQNASRQRVMEKDVIDAIPVGRSHQSLAILIPGLSTSTGINAQTQDVGGTNNLRLANAFTIHGGRTSDSNVQLDGFQVRNIGSFANLTNMFPDMGATQEMTIDYAAGLGEAATGGVKVNYVPREGGNAFRFSFFGTGVNSSFQGDNYSDELKARGLTTPNSLRKAYDVNGSAGGPILRDKLWFFASIRRQLNSTYFANLYYNRNAGDPTKWNYDPDLGQQAYTAILQPDINGRLTWQALPKHKVGFFYTRQPRDVFGDRSNVSPESMNYFKFDKSHLMTVSWQSPATNKLLLDARLATHGEELYNSVWDDDPASVWRSLIAVTEQGGQFPGLLYRGAGQAAGPTFIFAAMSAPNIWELRGSVTYVTGAHALKFGVGNSWGRQYLLERDIHSATSYRFNNGVPNQITMRASPVSRYDDLKSELGLYVQDKWTIDSLTLSGGLRFDYFRTYFPETPLGPGPLVPNRNFVVAQYRLVRLEGPLAARRRRVRPVRHRQDRAQGQLRPLRAGRRQHGRQRLLDPGQHGDAVVERSRRAGHRRRLRAAVRSPQPSGQRRVRHHLRPALRHAGAEHGLRPRGAGGLGQARLQLGALGRRAARAHQPRGHRRRLLPPHLRQLHGDRQPGRGRVRLQPLPDRRAGRSRVCPMVAATP